MKRRFVFLPLAFGSALLALSCNDTLRPDATGSIALQIVIPPEPVFSGPARSPAQPAGVLTSATATATSGSTTKTVTLTGGSSSSNFTGTITGLPVGTYTVIVQGFIGSEVDYYGQTSGVTVTANATSNATVNFQLFAPTLNAFPTATTWSFAPAVTITAVPNATGYMVEADRSNTFPNPSRVTTSGGAAYFTASDTGTWYVRARATNAVVTTGGVPSATQSIRVVTDLRPSGTGLTSPASLGFFATRTTPVDSVNIYPASDVDWFQISDCNGDSLLVTAQAVRLNPPSPLNSALLLFSGATGRLLAANDNADSTDARIGTRMTADGNYVVAVAGSGSTVGHYKLAVVATAGANNNLTTCKVNPFPVTTVTAGLYHSCSVRSGGIVDCWGRNLYGELGNGTAGTASSSPTRVSGSQTFQTASAGGLHTCALTTGGAAYCWGRNGNGQLGNGSTSDASSPVAVSGSRTYQTISAGLFHTCGINTAGHIYCWGSNFNGKLGNGTTVSSSTPDSAATSTQFSAIGAGEQHTCALSTGGVVYCWGYNGNGQLGNGNYTDSSLPVTVGSGYVALAVGGYHTCALTSTGSVYCWGYGGYGELGNGGFGDSNIPVLVSGALTFNSIVAGRYTTCGIASAVAYCWGDNFDGEVGDNTTTHQSIPTPVATGVTFQSMGVGGYHTCASELGSGNAYCWGWNAFGQLGDGLGLEQTGPVAIGGLPSLVMVSTGNEHTCAIGTDGSPYCWGWNINGQLGDGSYTDRGVPALVSGGLIGNFTAIGAGQQHSCTLRPSDGAVYCWGDNSHGQLGDGTTTGSGLPVPVSGSPSPFTAISVGDYHTCGVGQDAKIYCWGQNDRGQLGDGSTLDASNPSAVSSAQSWKQVSAGGMITCGLTTTNQVYCWGDNTQGSNGNGTTSPDPVNTPVLTLLPSGNYASVSAGYDFACAVSTTGSGYCWGDNDAGQLGDGTTIGRTQPVAVSGGSSWKTISASRTSTTCGITSADLLRCWGNNFTGQLGNGTFVDANTPSLVLAVGAWQTVQAGDAHTCGVSGGLAYCWGDDERGELGRGSATGIRKTPGAVVTGPAAAPVMASASYALPGPLDANVARPQARGAASLERSRIPFRSPRR